MDAFWLPTQIHAEIDGNHIDLRAIFGCCKDQNVVRFAFLAVRENLLGERLSGTHARRSQARCPDNRSNPATPRNCDPQFGPFAEPNLWWLLSQKKKSLLPGSTKQLACDFVNDWRTSLPARAEPTEALKNGDLPELGEAIIWQSVRGRTRLSERVGSRVACKSIFNNHPPYA